MQEEAARGAFRSDLYYRLNAVQLALLPLRSRREEIQPLTEHFIARYRSEAAVVAAQERQLVGPSVVDPVLVA